MTTQLEKTMEEKTKELKALVKKIQGMKASPEKVEIAQKAKEISYTLEFLPAFIHGILQGYNT